MADLSPGSPEAALLTEELRRLRAVFNGMEDAVFLAPISDNGVHGNFIEVNEEACRRLGYSREELLQLNARTLNPRANLLKIRSFGRQIVREGSTVFEAIHRAKDGTELPVEVLARTLKIGDSHYVLSVVRDLREETSRKSADSRFGYIVDHMWDEIYIFRQDDLMLEFANHGARENLGFSRSGMHGRQFIDLLDDLGREEFDRQSRPLFEAQENQVVFEANMRRVDGSTYPVEVRLQLTHNEVPPLFLANVRDITKRKQAEEKLAYLANYDSLTGLPNRNLFLDRLTMAMEQAGRSDTLIAVMFLDIDNFKTVNDTLGHQAGDELIVEVARRLTGSVRKSDTVSRLAGDEFTIVLTNLCHVQDADRVAATIREAITRPVLINNKNVYVGVSIGITFYPMDDRPDAAQLLKQSDAAMYQAKKNGKNCYCHYSAELEKSNSRRRQLEADIKEAFYREQFVLHYQPRVNLSDGKVLGAESLIRWHHPTLGMVGPLEFIHILEQIGMIKKVGLWILRESCRQLAVWQKIRPGTRISVNVSARQLEGDDFVMDLQDTIGELGIDARYLELEVTEGLFLSSNIDIVDRLRRIKELGIKISLDDFGSGYSSLNYLKNFPIDVLKIDRSFVRDLESETVGAIITETIIQLAQRLNLSVVAEGIESARQATILQNKGCTQGQGYYFGKPMPAVEFERLLRGESSNIVSFTRPAD